MFAVDTTNANAWPGAEGYCTDTAADFACIQEARVPAGAIAETEAAMRALNWSMSITACGKGPGGGRSAGVAIGAKAHIGMRNSLAQDLPEDASKTRLDLKWMGAAVKGGFHLGSMYLISKIGVQAEENESILDAAVARLGLLNGPWILGCDGNCTPEQLAETGWLKKVGATIFQPPEKTCEIGEGRIIDFFVVSNDFVPYVIGAFISVMRGCTRIRR
jgi:hypothetical protein